MADRCGRRYGSRYHRRLAAGRIERANWPAALACARGVVHLSCSLNCLLLVGEGKNVVARAADHCRRTCQREMFCRIKPARDHPDCRQSLAALRPEKITKDRAIGETSGVDARIVHRK